MIFKEVNENMGIGVITNPVVIIFALLVLLKEMEIWHGGLAKLAIIMMISYALLTYISIKT